MSDELISKTNNAETTEETVSLPKSAVSVIKRLLADLESAAETLNRLLPEEKRETSLLSSSRPEAEELKTGGRVIEGVFDGERMVGADGQTYTVPANYASKSKLIEGDMLKLTITPAGAFIFKQTGPIERKRLTGELIDREGAENQYDAAADGKVFHVLAASVTYFKGKIGDTAIVLVPKNSPSRFAAIENIIKK